MSSRNDWPEARIGDLGDIRTGRTPPTEQQSYFGRAYPFITPGDMRQGRYARETQRYLSNEGALLLQRIRVPANSVCVSCIGWQMGEVIMTDKPSFTNQQINTIVPNEKIEPKFLYYALVPRKQELLSFGSGTGVRTPILNKTSFSNLKVKIPPRPIQSRIASILGAYDDLIEVNRRRIAVLEEMARRLFDEWFVHFRFPGHKGHAMVETELGGLPEGWCWAPLEDFLILQRGFDLPSHDRKAGEVPLVSASGISGTHSVARVQAPGIVTGRSGTIGGVFFIHDDFWPLNTTLYVKEFKRASPTFALHLLRNLDLKSRAVGAAVPTLNRNHVHGLLLPCPPTALVGQFEEHASTLLQAVRGLERSQAALATSRDLLLPRLISGELAVDAAEAVLVPAA